MRNYDTPEEGVIEVTPEMVEAGMAEFFAYDPRFQDGAEAVTAIFQAMAMASIRAQGRMFDPVNVEEAR